MMITPWCVLPGDATWWCCPAPVPVWSGLMQGEFGLCGGVRVARPGKRIETWPGCSRPLGRVHTNKKATTVLGDRLEVETLVRLRFLV